jgi:WD40 repeat protein
VGGSPHVLIIDPETGAERALANPAEGADQPVLEWSAVEWSPDGRHLAAAGREREGNERSESWVRIWDAGTDRVVASLRGHKGRILGLAWSRDGRLLASGGYDDKTVRIWTVATRQSVVLQTTRVVTSLAFSPDATRLAVGGEGSDVGQDAVFDRLWGIIGLWDVSAGVMMGEIRAHRAELNDISWSPDGDLLASAGDDGRVRLWPVSMSRLLRMIPPRLQSFVMPRNECERYFGTPTCPPVR